MRKTGLGVAALGAAIVASTVPVSAPAAHADHPNTVCSYWGPAGEASHHVQVDWMMGRSFRVAITDFTLLAAESEAGDRFLTLPLDPNLRLSTNTVTVADGLGISDVSISQSVAAGSGSDPHGQVDGYRKAPSAPWESASVTDPRIVWLQDVDARSDANGVQSRPSETPTADARAADAAGVLEFTVTVPDETGGEVALIAGITSSLTQGVLGSETGEWVPGHPLTRTVPGCTVDVEPVGAPAPQPEPDPELEEEQESPSGKTPAQGQAPGDSAPRQNTTPRPDSTPDQTPSKGSSKESAPGSGEQRRTPGATGGGAADSAVGHGADHRADRGSGDTGSVAESGGSDATLWIAGAGAIAALGIALTIAARRSAR